jgi:hypothetical protein
MNRFLTLVGATLAGCLVGVQAVAATYQASFTGNVISFETNHGMFGFQGSDWRGHEGSMTFIYSLPESGAAREGPFETFEVSGIRVRGHPSGTNIDHASIRLNGQTFSRGGETTLTNIQLVNHLGRASGRDSAQFSFTQIGRPYPYDNHWWAEATGTDLRDWITDPRHNRFSGNFGFSQYYCVGPPPNQCVETLETNILFALTGLSISRLEGGPTAVAMAAPVSASIAPVPLPGGAALILAAFGLFSLLVGRAQHIRK